MQVIPWNGRRPSRHQKIKLNGIMIAQVGRHMQERLTSSRRKPPSLMRRKYGKGKSSTKRFKRRMTTCEGLHGRTDNSDHSPSFGSSTIRQLALHYGLKWPLSSIHHPDSHLFIYTTARPFILILIFEKWPLCSKLKFGSRFLAISLFS